MSDHCPNGARPNGTCPDGLVPGAGHLVHMPGHIYIRTGRYADAEVLYREDLDYFAENGWSLHGLAQSLRAQKRTEEATVVQKRFETAWTHADIQLAWTPDESV